MSEIGERKQQDEMKKSLWRLNRYESAACALNIGAQFRSKCYDS